MRDTNCFTAIITARDGVDRADGSAPLPAVSKAPSPIMPHNGLTVAPAGYRWIYVNNNITLINRSGVIVRSVPRVW